MEGARKLRESHQSRQRLSRPFQNRRRQAGTGQGAGRSESASAGRVGRAFGGSG